MDKTKNENTTKPQGRPEGSKENIEKGLSSLKAAGKLKSENPVREDTLESKMPSRVEKQEEEFKPIKIPIPKHFGKDKRTEQIITSSNIHSQPLVYEKEKQEAARKTLQEQNKGLKGTQQAKQDDSIFGGQEEISRIKLRQKLRYDPKIWEAQRSLRMNLSPMERVKLEKETFAPVYGRNISKKDLKLSVKRLGREWASTTDMKRKEALRKEIKFFKKIGGIG